MRFLVDNSLSPLVAAELRKAGHDALHVRDLGMQRSSDEEIMQFAERDGRVVIAADTDFGTLLALRQSVSPSVILLRTATRRRPSAQAALLLSNLDMIEDALHRGSVVVFEETRVRIRQLPVAGNEGLRTG